MSTSSIDELLLGGKTHEHPETPEHQYDDSPTEIEEVEADSPDYGEEVTDEPQSERRSIEPEEDEQPEEQSGKEYDDYGNEKPKPRMYTEEEVNEMFRRRFKNKPQAEQQAAMQQVQQAQAQGFEYNPESEQTLPQQLESFIEQTVSRMTNREQEKQRIAKEQEIQAEFEDKFAQGMSKFHDFRDVMLGLPFEISNPMTLATRSMENPAAFLYAAAKRNPQELERISKLRDPYAQMTEMGKLEERMRRNKPTTKAPRPLSRTHEDTGTPAPKKKTEPTIEDLIAKSDAKKLARMKQHRR